ncbi:MAG TPA: 4Fe-4S cluster-binding domain-containing protein [Anaerohalosphaeraceae bacterium]|nr:4Fe-4S cluster-binding domain-containing protein [Anaerohalosphaeraceae bacterium]
MEQSQQANSGNPDGTGSGYVHPQYGDLGVPGSVNTRHNLSQAEPFFEDNPYMLHLSVTGRCNAHCIGCISSSITFKENPSEPQSKEFDVQPQRDSMAIRQLLADRKEDYAVICLYGGEPLLECEKIQQTIDLLSVNPPLPLRYMLYTNGQLLEESIRQFPQLFRKLWLVSVSIDGQTEQHNANRPGTDLTRIHRGLRNLSQYPTASVLMWSTLREGQSLTDCFEEFLYLYEHGLADHWFFHWIETDKPFEDFGRYLQEYESQLRQVMHIYLEFLGLGRILSIVHISELVLYLLSGKLRGSTACGVELEKNYDIAGGKIMACADLGPKWVLGLVNPDGSPEIQPKELSKLIAYKNELGCGSCGVHPYCGGRCPVEGLTASRQRLSEYCQLMRLHVAVVKEYLPHIQRAMKLQDIDLQRLYDHSAFYAQFTDVTP